MFEELLMDEEGLQDTENKLIHIGKPIEMNDEWFKTKLKQLDEAAYREEQSMKSIVAEIVPTYHPKKGRNTEQCMYTPGAITQLSEL